MLLGLLLLSGDVEPNPGPCVTNMNLGLINAHSVTKKIPLIHNLIDEYDLKCLAITETWLKASCSDTAILDVAPPGYSIHYTHRPGEKSGGGVAIVAHKSLNAKPINLQYNYSSFESVVVRLSVSNNKRLNVVVLYRPPRSADFVNEIHMLIQESASMPGEQLLLVTLTRRRLLLVI